MAVKRIPTIAQENERVVSFSISPLTDFCDDSERYLVELYEADMRDVGTVLNDYNLVDQFLKKLMNSVFSTEFTMAYGSMLRDLSKQMIFPSFMSNGKSVLTHLIFQIQEKMVKQTNSRKSLGNSYPRSDQATTLESD